MKQPDKIVLKKIIRYCDDIEKIILEHGDSYDFFRENMTYQYACSMCIIQIGELISRISDEVTEAYNDIDWRNIKGMRNIFAHDYERVDLDILWKTISNRIPELRKRIGDILESDLTIAEINERAISSMTPEEFHRAAIEYDRANPTGPM